MDALPVALGVVALIIFLIGVAALINLSTKKREGGSSSQV